MKVKKEICKIIDPAVLLFQENDNSSIQLSVKPKNLTATVDKIKKSNEFLYEKISAKILEMIKNGTYRPGDRIPSIRSLSRQMHVSINTIMGAYVKLENDGIIEARPNSGYYVSAQHRSTSFRGKENEIARLYTPHRKAQGITFEYSSNLVTLGDDKVKVMTEITNPTLIPLGAGIPNYDLLPFDKLNRMLAAEARRSKVRSVSYTSAQGDNRLRTQIVKQSFNSNYSLTSEDIIITTGCFEAIVISLLSICRVGDVVALGSPICYTYFKTLEWLGLKVIEIPSSYNEGLNLDFLAYAIKRNQVRAVISLANFNNPLAYVMSDEKKKELVKLLAENDIPLIEDDVYGDLAFGTTRPLPIQSFDKKGLVIYCSSFSKTLAPGYRVGWVSPGRFLDNILQIKALLNIASASPTQIAVAEFLANGGYARHLRTFAKIYAQQMVQVREAVLRYFPLGTIVNPAKGGFMFWVELPECFDTYKLYEAALREGISIAPGMLFTSGDKYGNCLRISFAFWSKKIEKAIETLGQTASTVCYSEYGIR